MLISANELAQKISTQTCIVFDCRFRLGQPQWGQEEYALAHIPSAYFLDLERDLSAPVTIHGGRHPLPDEVALATKLGQFGVDPGTTVVVYDGGEGMAPHAWWLIRYLGHADVRVLNGGLAAWTREGYELTDEVHPPSPREFSLSPHREWLVDRDAVMAIVTGKQNGVLVDARVPERYRGDVEPIDARAGHIPLAENAPWTEGVDELGVWKPREAQQARFQAMTESGNPLILYCGSGVTACANALALHLSGHENYRLYAGSWSDWVSYPDAPLATDNAVGKSHH